MLTTARAPVPVPAARSARERAVQALEQLVQGAANGHGGALAVAGEPGVGKTTLLRAAASRAQASARVERMAAVESETELPYAGLHLLCGRVADDRRRLPAPQLNALETALGLRPAAPPDPFLVGLAVHSLLAEAASERALVCLVDDAHWLDEASARVLGFVARRLASERVALIFALREVPPSLAGVRSLPVDGLDVTAARALFDRIVPGSIDVQVRDQLISEARGNPQALRALTHGLTPAQLAGGFALVGSAPLARRIERDALAQLEALPEPTRLVLILAAADPTGNPALLWRAGELLELGPEPVDAAVAGGALAIGTRVTFRDPLLRSAVYRAASVEERRRVHAALAEATSAEHEPDRCAWHRARATLELDEAVAGALERSAAQARRRGGIAATAAFLERAAALTPDRMRRARRLLAAAQAKAEAGAPGAALALLDSLEPHDLTAPDRARAGGLRARAGYELHRTRDTIWPLVTAARDLPLSERRLAHALYLTALAAARHAGCPDDQARVGRAVLEDDSSADALFVRGMARFATGDREAAVPLLRRALGEPPDGSRAEAAVPVLRHALDEPPDGSRAEAACQAATDLWDAAAYGMLAARHVASARADGALTRLPMALTHAVSAHILAGDLDAAEMLAEEADHVIDATSHALPRLGSLQVAAWRGDEPRVRRLAAEIRRDAPEHGDVLDVVARCEAVLDNALGRYAAVVAAADERGLWVLPEIVLAAARAGDRALGERALRELTDATRALDGDWVLGTLAAARAHLQDGDGAEALHREAIARFRRARLPLLEGRAQLGLGEWLRRRGRRVDAREALKAAHALLAGGGAAAFAERARRELAATGETTHRRTLGGHEPLTVQERNIARLACDGLTNREIATRLFISARTVEYHLRKVFFKLGISSRRQLSVALHTSA